MFGVHPQSVRPTHHRRYGQPTSAGRQRLELSRESSCGDIATEAPSFAPALYPRSTSLDITTRPSSWSL